MPSGGGNPYFEAQLQYGTEGSGAIKRSDF
jgi:hypothetical protein